MVNYCHRIAYYELRSNHSQTEMSENFFMACLKLECDE